MPSAAPTGEEASAQSVGDAIEACPSRSSTLAPNFQGYAVEERTTTSSSIAGVKPDTPRAGHATDGRSISQPGYPRLTPGSRREPHSGFHTNCDAGSARPRNSNTSPSGRSLTAPSVVGTQRPTPAATIMAALQQESAQRARLWEAIRLATLRATFQRAGVELPPAITTKLAGSNKEVFSLNKPLQAAMSEYIRRVRPSLPAFVELVRGQTVDDYRPNKAQLPEVLRRQCEGYTHLDALVRIASEGVRVKMRKPLPVQRRFPQNHPSATKRINVLRKNIRKEQDLFRCLVLDADIAEVWTEIFLSPFGVVDKGDGDPRVTGRVIHDHSFPESESVNYNTDTADVPKPAYEHCSQIAQEILRCKRENPDDVVRLMAGDVAIAYRNACTHSECVRYFCGHIPEDIAIIIDMSADFGWTGSAGTYSVLGGAVAFIHGSTCDVDHPSGYFNYHWVDDHVNVASNIGTRCADVERSLRFAMKVVMGPAAVNKDKFTQWSIHQKVLGLLFDTSASTVAMPAPKVAKAQGLVAHAFHAAWISRGQLRSLLGSLRHVATCVRPAQAFLQRLRAGEKALHRRVRVTITAPMPDGLVWWWHIISNSSLNGVPLVYFAALPEPDLTVTTDASDEGFQTWAAEWRMAFPQASSLRVHFRIDNTSAFAWQTKMVSRNSRAQILIRLLSLWEHQFNLRFSASHIRGVDNTVADAGSRRWANASIFESTQLQIPPSNGMPGHSPTGSGGPLLEASDGAFTSPHLGQLQILSDYIIDCALHGFGSNHAVRCSNVKANLMGIRHFMRAAGRDFPVAHPQLRMLLKNVARLDGPSGQKAPVSIAILEASFRQLDLTDPADQALWGVLCLAFFFLLRRSEIAATSATKFEWFALNGNDVAVADANGKLTIDPRTATAVYIRLRGSKTNQNGKPVTRLLTRSRHEFPCPVLGALLLLQARSGLPPGIPAAVFVGVDGLPSCVTAARVARVIKAGAPAVGEDPTRFGTHSLRAGGATDMYRAGVDVLTIQLHGRWASDAFKLYTRLCRESVESVSAKIVSGSRASTVLR
ncbi:hypothetical protein PR003_g19053 [Phytophthora rubi]|uniref:Tyr recombinase domain-containing protein n=2 Tax=Phytophthora rubi TaxID=129364 RepID=A0A6A4E8N9_9STRA|nr:hypothetical protein PR003_g19053 [Phytophthora rubi]